MSSNPTFVDIHCHILPGIDDGSSSLESSVAMAELAFRDGIRQVIATPHQLGNFAANTADRIQPLLHETQAAIHQAGIDLTLFPGGDVRIEPDMIGELRNGSVLSLAGKGKHVLLELPHDLYFALDDVLIQLHQLGMQGILSHPERNAGILARPSLIDELVSQGCLMQVTAGSLMGTFGPASQQLAENMLTSGTAHFLATDAHGPKKRRPLLGRAYRRAMELAGPSAAELICCANPARVVQGEPVQPGWLKQQTNPSETKQTRSRRSRWFARTA